MGRPPSDLDDYLEWQQRLESQGPEIFARARG